MGVMACGREGCQHILCDRLIKWNDGTSSYICDDCCVELKQFRKSWSKSMTIAEVEEHIRQFMDTAPGSHATLDSNEIEAQFNKMIGDDNVN